MCFSPTIVAIVIKTNQKFRCAQYSEKPTTTFLTLYEVYQNSTQTWVLQLHFTQTGFCDAKDLKLERHNCDSCDRSFLSKYTLQYHHKACHSKHVEIEHAKNNSFVAKLPTKSCDKVPGITHPGDGKGVTLFRIQPRKILPKPPQNWRVHYKFCVLKYHCC